MIHSHAFVKHVKKSGGRVMILETRMAVSVGDGGASLAHVLSLS